MDTEAYKAGYNDGYLEGIYSDNVKEDSLQYHLGFQDGYNKYVSEFKDAPGAQSGD